MSSRIEAEVEALEDLGDDQFRAVLADVQEAIQRVVDMNIDLEEPGDLERLRRALPTEPHRAQLIHASLPTPIQESIEYVSESERQSAHWRRSRERRDPSALSEAELRQRIEFVEAAMATRGEGGVVETADGRRVSRAPMLIGEQLRDEGHREELDTDADDDREKGQALLRRIVDRL